MTLSDRAFDAWLAGELHWLHDAVVNEPIPPALLALINQDRRYS